VAKGQLVATSVQQIVEDIRVRARSNQERGALFEKLMHGFLTTDSVFVDRFSQVWLWRDWPGRAGRPDTGIDLVAEERDGGGVCAIQCKFYEPDHTLSKPDIDSFLSASGKAPFTDRLIISTTEKWNTNAEDAITGQHIRVSRLGLADLTNSSVDWDAAWPSGRVEIDPANFHRKKPNQLREHQIEAVEAVLAGFRAGHDRGKMIMACGTGKTFTALKIAERIADEKRAAQPSEPTRVLFLLPSIALLSQTLREWADNAEQRLRPFAVCSDAKATRRANDDSADMAAHDLALPSTTDPALLAERVDKAAIQASELMVVFSTYQSIEVLSRAQGLGLPAFDLIVCDEAHRTTGVTLSGADESHFVKVHDSAFLAGQRRLYMTATPRLYSESTQQQAQANDAELCSMDNEAQYGPEFYRLGFGKAVELGLLTDYKVIVLAVNEDYVSATFQAQLADSNNELNLDDACKIVGCWNALSKRSGTTAEGAAGFAPGEAPMKRAVAFAANIKASKLIADLFADTVETCRESDGKGVSCEVHHVDGTMNALVRNRELNWLKQDMGDGECRILTNARCLSEDVW
jgi:predicted helicase